MAKNSDFCGVGNLIVIIPYKDLENLLKSAQKVDEMSEAYKRMERRNAAMQTMYAEMLEVLCEIKRESRNL